MVEQNYKRWFSSGSWRRKLIFTTFLGFPLPKITLCGKNRRQFCWLKSDLSSYLKCFLSVSAETLLVYKQHVQHLLSVLFSFMPPKLLVFSRCCGAGTRCFAAQSKLAGATSGLIQDLANRWASKAEPWWPAIKEVLPGCLNNSRGITGISSRAIWLWFFQLFFLLTHRATKWRKRWFFSLP